VRSSNFTQVADALVQQLLVARWVDAVDILGNRRGEAAERGVDFLEPAARQQVQQLLGIARRLGLLQHIDVRGSEGQGIALLCGRALHIGRGADGARGDLATLAGVHAEGLQAVGDALALAAQVVGGRQRELLVEPACELIGLVAYPEQLLPQRVLAGQRLQQPLQCVGVFCLLEASGLFLGPLARRADGTEQIDACGGIFLAQRVQRHVVGQQACGGDVGAA
jgi:hypothetical protein